MAAADYYNPGGQQRPSGPQPAPSSQNLAPNPPYPMSDLPPPPYTPFAEQQNNRPHSQPPPQHRPSTSDQFHPTPPQYPPPNNAQYPPDKNGRLPTQPVDNFGAPYTAQPYQQPQQPYQQPQGYFPLAGTPAMQQVYGNGAGNGRRPSTTPGHRPSRRDESRSLSRSRSRSRDRSRHSKHHHHHRPEMQRKKSSGVNTFLGAGGGALIGDAIFPGLGTLGGALLGGIGGHEYGKNKNRSASNPSKSRRAYDDAYYDDYKRGRKY